MNTSHYPSLELRKKLTEAGFPTTDLGIQWNYGNGSHKYFRNKRTDFVCPSVMELLDELPQSVNGGALSIHKEPEIWMCMYDKPFEQAEISSGDTLPNALAEMILWLHENKYISFTK